MGYKISPNFIYPHGLFSFDGSGRVTYLGLDPYMGLVTDRPNLKNNKRASHFFSILYLHDFEVFLFWLPSPHVAT
jgi:hypothetical protein